MLKKSPHPEDIKAALRKRHGNISRFEIGVNLPRGAVRDVLRGKSRMAVAQVIATDLGMNVSDLSPEKIRSHLRDNSAVKTNAHYPNKAAV